EIVPQIEREVLGREDLPRLVRRTVIRAAPALRAGIEIEDRLPREVIDPRHAHRQARRIGVLGGGPHDLHQLRGVLRHRTAPLAPHKYAWRSASASEQPSYIMSASIIVAMIPRMRSPSQWSVILFSFLITR